MSKHTPTPYKLKGKSVNGKPHFNVIGTRLGSTYRVCRVPFLVTGDAEANEILEAEARETAKFIVKACNNHDRLVETLEDSSRMLGRIRRSMMAHPDHEEGSEFDDMTTSAQSIEDKIIQLLTELKHQ